MNKKCRVRVKNHGRILGRNVNDGKKIQLNVLQYPDYSNIYDRVLNISPLCPFIMIYFKIKLMMYQKKANHSRQQGSILGCVRLQTSSFTLLQKFPL